MAISAVKEIEFINFNKLEKPISDFLSKEFDLDKTNKEYAETVNKAKALMRAVD